MEGGVERVNKSNDARSTTTYWRIPWYRYIVYYMIYIIPSRKPPLPCVSSVLNHACVWVMRLNVCVTKKKTMSNYVFGQEIAVRQEGGHVGRVDPEQLSVVELGFRVSAKRRERVCQGVQHCLKSDTVVLVFFQYILYKCSDDNR